MAQAQAPQEIYRRVKKLRFNYYTTPEGPKYEEVELGKKGVVQIGEHLPQGLGDIMYYEVMYEDGAMLRVYLPNTVFFEKVNPSNIVVPDSGLVLPN